MRQTLDRQLFGHRLGARPTARISAAAITATAVVVLLAGCVGSPSSAGSGGSATASSGSTYAQDALAYARCVQAHGVPGFPDPNADGTFPKASIPPGSGTQMTAANRTCGHLLPARGSMHEVTTKQQQDYIKVAGCMRSHGISNFPDPVFTDGNVKFPLPSNISTTSTQFMSARAICTKLIPAGLPYSAPAG
jgi:hypothetical protein